MYSTKILIPGLWETYSDCVIKIAQGKKYLFAYKILMSIEKKISYSSWLSDDWSPNDYQEEFPQFFLRGVPHCEADSPIKSLFVIDAKLETWQDLENLHQAVSGVLEAGGLGVKILNSSKVISAEGWKNLNFTLEEAFELFVSVYETDKGTITCGMSNFGHKDILVPLSLDEDALTLVRTFAWYLIDEKAKINDGETFSLPEEEAPLFKIFSSDDDVRVEENHRFFNPYGLWKLWPLEWLNT